MNLYYDRIFPFNLLYKWLTHSSMNTTANSIDSLSFVEDGDSQLLSCREFSMSVSRDEDEFYMRWHSFPNGEALKKKLLSMSPPPHKIDIGAIYSLPVGRAKILMKVSQKESGNHFFPKEKEIVLDIDMNDYDEIRTCCKDKKICQKCWRFLVIAMDMLEATLREDLGFRHLLWVFSGRRGVHCWICDAAAKKYPTVYRQALADYLNIVTVRINSH
ncbi:LOW QUALITY PROTEIN: DNA primase small subunit-like [Condylostylus longicornis]|uniref:LOW QUALITY PROTEIN: DNA primase small subunit-like n=1 Tax=Condylostylus longicornis TaxID=2530218 RepID=UPI00244DBA1C|nr:LOW QUALITY PROTEIN: DNA primase small subunit-like [Condylostylus longicornis]